MKRKFIYPRFDEDNIIVLEVGESKELKVDIINCKGEPTEELQYSSDDKNIVEISDDGIITGASVGKVNVHSFIYGKSCYLNVKVIEPRKVKLQYTSNGGVTLLAPKNTVEAFRVAEDNQFDFFATDVRVTQDKKFVLYSDETLAKFDEEDYIKDCTLGKLESYIYDFISQEGIREYPEAHITSLDDMLECASQNHQMRLVLRLIDETFIDENNNLLQEIYHLICQYHLEDTIRIASPFKEVLDSLRNISSNIDMGYICDSAEFDDINYLEKNQFMLYWKYSVSNYDIINTLSQKNIDVDLWYIDDKELRADLMDWPITSVTTNVILVDSPTLRENRKRKRRPLEED